MKRWFHKEDGGLMVMDRPLWSGEKFDGRFYRCAVCGERVFCYGGGVFVFPYPSAPLADIDDRSVNFAHFSGLPEDLQSAALAEML